MAQVWVNVCTEMKEGDEMVILKVKETLQSMTHGRVNFREDRHLPPCLETECDYSRRVGWFFSPWITLCTFGPISLNDS